MNIHVDIHTMLCETGSGSKHKAYIEAISCSCLWAELSVIPDRLPPKISGISSIRELLTQFYESGPGFDWAEAVPIGNSGIPPKY